MENPTLDFLLYLIGRCLRECQVDPESTTVKEFMSIIQTVETPLGV